MRILIVDDSEDTTFTTSALLERAGHEVRIAVNGEEALVLAADFRPEVVLLDICLPNMDGYEVAWRLRRVPNCERVHIIAVSGLIPDDGLDEAAGIDCHLLKPISVQVILGEMRSRRSLQELSQNGPA